MQGQKRSQAIMKLAPWIMVFIVVALLSTAAVGGYVFKKDWSGVNETTQTKKSTQYIRPEKTLWDWLQLLIIPVTVAGAGIWFNWAQRSRELEIEQQRRQSDLEVEDQRAQDDALQAYLDYMGALILDKNLRGSRPNEGVAAVARARTLAVLTRLNDIHEELNKVGNDEVGEDRKNTRKRSLLQFLYEAGLLRRESPVISLNHADLSNADLSLVPGVGVGSGTALARFNLSKSNLQSVIFVGADLSDSNLEDADLGGANLFNADLRGADLTGALLRKAFLANADLRGAHLARADLTGATGLSTRQRSLLQSAPGLVMPDGLRNPDPQQSPAEEGKIMGALVLSVTLAVLAYLINGGHHCNHEDNNSS